MTYLEVCMLITITRLSKTIIHRVTERGDTTSSKRRDVDVARERRFSDERHGALVVPLLVVRQRVHANDLS